MRFVFRLEANSQTGLGHAMRCLGLAQGLLDHGHDCLLLALNSDLQMLQGWYDEHKKNPKLEIHQVKGSYVTGSQEDGHYTENILKQFYTDWLILDHYDFTENYHQHLRKKVYSFSFSDGAQDPLSTDIVLNQNACLGNEKQMFTNGTLFLQGCEYFLARRQLLHLRQNQGTCDKPPALLVTLGGADQENLGYQICEKLLPALEQNIPVTLTCTGNQADFACAKQLAAHFAQFKPLWKPDLAKILDQYSMAICAGGVTSLELALLGIASVILITADNQQAGALALADLGGACLAHSPKEALEIILRLTNQDEERRQISVQAKSLVDGYGPKRICQIIENFKK